MHTLAEIAPSECFLATNINGVISTGFVVVVVVLVVVEVVVVVVVVVFRFVDVIHVHN